MNLNPFAPRSVEVDSNDYAAPNKIADAIVKLCGRDLDGRKLVVMCIGTDRSTGDALGPLVGSFLQENFSIDHPLILGTLESPVTAVNLDSKIAWVKSAYRNPFIIAIDACLGRVESIGNVTIAKGPLKPGEGVGKDLTPVGDVSITGVVNVGGFMESFILQVTHLNVVMRIAKAITAGVTMGVRRLLEY